MTQKNQNTIRFREIQKSDYTALARIIQDTWGYKSFCSPKVAEKMGRLYLASCLANQTFTCVALNNNEPVGIIMGRNKNIRSTPIQYKLGQFKAVLSMLIDKEGRTVAKMFKDLGSLDQKMLDESGEKFSGELAFFAVRNDQRGTGIGKELFSRLLRYMQSQRIQSFYLYTDSSCNYGFYEHQGMQRIGERSFSLRPYRKEDMQFFVYKYSF